jgi:hypothetical protein
MLHYLHLQTTPEAEGDPLGDFLKKPIDKLKKLDSYFTESTKTISLMDVEMGKVIKSMGTSVQYGLALKENFNLAYQEVVNLGGKLSDVTDQQDALLDVSGRNLISLTSQSEELFAAVSVTGLKASELQKSFYDAGMEGAHIAENVLKIVQVSNQLGVNAQAVSSVVTTNLDKLNRFGFTNGVEGLAKMAGKAQALRFDVSETFELAEDLMSPEKAIETAAAIQRLGGAATALTDPLKLMDLAQNDVGGLQDELGKLAKQYTYFDEKSKTFQIMPGARRQLNEVANALGIDRKEFEKMALETSKLEDKMSKIKFSGLDISKEDQEQLANLAQLKDIGGGKKEYVINYKDENQKMQTVELSKLSELSNAQLEQIKKQTSAAEGVEGEDPQKQLVKIAENQLTAIAKLAAANEKIANTIPMTIASSKTGESALGAAANLNTKIGDAFEVVFGPKSDFKKGMDAFGESLSNFQEGGGFQKILKGNITDIKDVFTTGTATLFKGTREFIEMAVTQITSGKITPEKLPKALDGFYTPNGGTLSINDGFKKPTPVGDTIKTPGGSIEIYEKDYFLAATQLPDVLQKSVNKGLMDVLKIQGQSMNAAMMSTNTQRQPETQPQKQEVVHTVNFKVSVDGPKNKLTDMLVEELPKNPTLMQYIVKHFDNTKTSGGMTSKK